MIAGDKIASLRSALCRHGLILEDDLHVRELVLFGLSQRPLGLERLEALLFCLELANRPALQVSNSHTNAPVEM